MALIERSPRVAELIRRLDEAVVERDDAVRCRNVKRVLTDVVSSGQDFVDEAFLKPAPNRYARRLLHRDPQGRYSAVVMVWDRGQGTPLHDHAGHWCVECVYRGRIRVTSYDIRGGDPERDIVRFEQQSVIHAGVGESGALIPPFEYHVLENPDETPAITIHVYGEELTYCHIFEPVEGGYRRVFRELQYTDDSPQM